MGYKTQQVTGAVHLDQWIVYNKQLLIACFLQPGTAFRGKVCYPELRRDLPVLVIYRHPTLRSWRRSAEIRITSIDLSQRIYVFMPHQPLR